MSKESDRLIDDGERQLQEAGITRDTLWRHWKGEVVRVLSGCIDEAMLAPCVAYQHTHGGTCWTRRLSDWQSLVMGDDGKPVPRFTPYLEGKP